MVRAGFLFSCLLAVTLQSRASEVPSVGTGTPIPVLELRGDREGFLAPGEFVEGLLFPAAPAPDSPEDRADFAELRRLQGERSVEDCARARSEASAGYESFFGALSPYPMPLKRSEKAFFLLLAGDAGASSYILKRRYKRPRPFLRDSSLRPCIPKPKDWAYPSGHAALGRLWALVLADLVPARRDAFLARGDEIGLDRAIGGVHHPTDIAAGRHLGDELHGALGRLPAFREALERMRRRLPHP